MERTKDLYSLVFPDDRSKAEAFDQLAKNYYYRNFGTMQKAELDLLMFSIFMDRLYAMDSLSEMDYSDYRLSNLFGLTQARIRTLKERKETKYPSDFNWRKAFRKILGRAELKDGKVRLYINDSRLFTELSNEIQKLGSYSETSLTKNLIVVPPPVFVDLMMASYDEEAGEAREKNAVIDKLRQILEENDLDADAYLADLSISNLLKRSAAQTTERVLLSFFRLVPGVGEGLYESGKEIIGNIQSYFSSKAEKGKHNSESEA